MENQLLAIGKYIAESFLHTWPYLLITIPIAVAVKMSGASNYIQRAFTARPVLAIILATIVGAFSPLCSCSVIPVIAALLIGGVPLAPVMSFWLASPSMDPEIFFLTVTTLGWELAVWRLAATLAMSLGGGFLTQIFVQRMWLGSKFIRESQSTPVKTLGEIFKQTWIWAIHTFESVLGLKSSLGITISSGAIALSKGLPVVREEPIYGCSKTDEGNTCIKEVTYPAIKNKTQASESSFWKRLTVETWAATMMVAKFMMLAWILGALIRLYVPDTWIITTLGRDNPWAIITAAFLGIPVYTSSLAALPLVGGLLAQGMHPAAALAFLIAGPTTTLPAMSAVWGLVNRKVFALYLGFSLASAVILGYIYSFAL